MARKKVWTKEQLKEFMVEFIESERHKIRKGGNSSRVKKWREENPLKNKAHKLVFSSIRNGTLKKENCCICGSNKNVNAHHENYLKPLEIIWFCKKHHMERHTELNKLKL